MVDCSHNVRISNLCVECGIEIVDDKKLYNILHSNDEIKVVEDEAIKIDNQRLTNLKKSKKLILVLDLDQTVLHTTVSKEYVSGLHNFILDNVIYSVKLRPHLEYMLEKIYSLYEIHVYTMGTKEYAMKITRIIDPEGKYFGNRIISRNENNGEYVKNLNRLFSIHSDVVILDDRANVWDFCGNLLLVKPFWYFNTIDINDPKRIKKKT